MIDNSMEISIFVGRVYRLCDDDVVLPLFSLWFFCVSTWRSAVDGNCVLGWETNTK